MEVMWMWVWVLMSRASPHSRHVLLLFLETPWTLWPKRDHTIWGWRLLNDSTHFFHFSSHKQSYSEYKTLANFSHGVIPETLETQNCWNSSRAREEKKEKPIIMNWTPSSLPDKTFLSYFEAFLFVQSFLILAMRDGSMSLCCTWCVNLTFEVCDTSLVRVCLSDKSL